MLQVSSRVAAAWWVEHQQGGSTGIHGKGEWVRVDDCARVSVFPFIHICIHVYKYVYTCIFICIYIYIYIQIYIYIYFLFLLSWLSPFSTISKLAKLESILLLLFSPSFLMLIHSPFFPLPSFYPTCEGSHRCQRIRVWLCLRGRNRWRGYLW